MAICEQKTSTFTAKAGNPWGIDAGWTAGATMQSIGGKRYVGLDATDDEGMLREILHDCENDCDGVGKTYTRESVLQGRVKDTAPLTSPGGSCCVPIGKGNGCTPPWECVEVEGQAACDALGGVFFEKVACAPFPCDVEPVPCVYPPPVCEPAWNDVGPCPRTDVECSRPVTQWVISFSGIELCIPGPGPLGGALCHINFWNSTKHCFGCLPNANLPNLRRWRMFPPTGACQGIDGTSFGELSIQEGVFEPGGDVEYKTHLQILWGPPGFDPFFPLFKSSGVDDFFDAQSSCPSVNQITSIGWPNTTVCQPAGSDIAGDSGSATIELPRFTV